MMASIQQSSSKLADSAKRIERSTDRVEGSADRRTELAAERTYAAWVRTGLVSLASGIGARKLLEGVIPGWLVLSTGSVLVLFAAFCFVAGVWRDLRPVVPPPHPQTRRLPDWLLVVLNGFLALVAVAALVGVWFGHD
jgi:putative membrane protein